VGGRGVGVGDRAGRASTADHGRAEEDYGGHGARGSDRRG
jgi:hypothetical protein